MQIKFQVKPYNHDLGCYEAEASGGTVSRIHTEEGAMTPEEIAAQFKRSFVMHFEVEESAVEMDEG